MKKRQSCECILIRYFSIGRKMSGRDFDCFFNGSRIHQGLKRRPAFTRLYEKQPETGHAWAMFYLGDHYSAPFVVGLVNRFPELSKGAFEQVEDFESGATKFDLPEAPLLALPLVGEHPHPNGGADGQKGSDALYPRGNLARAVGRSAAKGKSDQPDEAIGDQHKLSGIVHRGQQSTASGCKLC